MKKIAIISSSVRTGKKSHLVAKYLSTYINQQQLAEVALLDLAEYDFPIFEERLKFQENPSELAKDFALKIANADGVIMVVPEYNGGYPASLKNAIDLLNDEWRRKPISFATVSAGGFGGTQVLMQVQFVLWKMRAMTVPVTFPISMVHQAFDEEGNATDKDFMDKRAALFLQELLWYIDARSTAQ